MKRMDETRRRSDMLPIADGDLNEQEDAAYSPLLEIAFDDRDLYALDSYLAELPCLYPN